MKRTFNLIVLLLIITAAQAQVSKKLLLTFEASSGDMQHELRNTWDLRQDVGHSYNYIYNIGRNAAGSVYTEALYQYIGIKPELIINDILSVATGIRYSVIMSDISPKRGGDSFFYLRQTPDNLTQTDFYRIKSIEETNHYISIPLEAKLRLFEPEWGRGFGLYGKVGGDLGFLVKNDRSIDFVNSTMQHHEDEFFKRNTISSALGTLYAGLNFQYKTYNGYVMGMNMPLFTAILTGDNSSLVETESTNRILSFSFSVPLSVFSK